MGGSEPEEEDWEDVDEVRSGSTCYNAKGKGKTLKGSGTSGGHKEGPLGESESWGYPRIVLDVRSDRTHVGRVSMGSRWYRGGRCRLPAKWRTT